MSEVRAVASKNHFPSAAFRAPALAALDARGRGELEAAGRVLRRRAGEAVFREGEPADAFYVVLDGEVCVEARRRGQERAELARAVGRGQSFGEEAALLGLARHSAAVARTDALVVEVPVALYARAAARAGTDEPLQRAIDDVRDALDKPR